MTGTTIAQAIPLAISPILSRLYTTEDFGILAVYSATIYIITTFATGGYEAAIVLPKQDKKAVNILGFSARMLMLVAAITLFSILFFRDYFAKYIVFEYTDLFLFFIPISLLLLGLYNNLNYFNLRKKHYKNISAASVWRSLVLGSSQLLFGVFQLGAIGLIIGQMLSMVGVNIPLAKPIKKYSRLLSWKAQKQVAKEYKEFPSYVMWSNGLSIGSSQFPVLLMKRFFGDATVGSFSFSQRIINTPMSILGSSIGQVFYQKSAEIKDDKTALKQLTFSTYKKLFAIGAVPFLILSFFADYIFGFVFGKEWIIAGKYTQYTSPWIFFVFISSPLSTLFFTLNKQKKALFFNILIFLSRILVLVAGYYFILGNDSTIALYGLVGLIFWMFWCFYILNMVGISYKKSVFFTFAYIIPGAGLTFLLRLLIDSWVA